MGPVDRFVYLSGITTTAGLFHPSYANWTVKRLTKILELYGVEYFNGRTVLELGCGHGDIGAFFAELGSTVLCLDGRLQNINLAKLKHRNVEGVSFQQFDLEHDFSEYGRFDILIDMGLLYHLREVDKHLSCCFATADEIVLETAVCDSGDPHLVLFRDEDVTVDEESLCGTGSRPSPFYIERMAEENGFHIVRCFSADLNAGPQFCYDWEHKDDGEAPETLRLRRFWRLTKHQASLASHSDAGGVASGSEIA